MQTFICLRFRSFHWIILSYTPLPEIANFSTKYFILSKVYTDEGGIKYRKNSKNWDTLNYHRDCPTNGIVAFYSAILPSKDSDRITNRVDTDQTAP